MPSSAPCFCLEKQLENLLLQPKFRLGSKDLGEMDKERTDSFQPHLSASNSVEAALFQFCSSILLCQPTGMSQRKIMLSGSLYFQCQTVEKFGGQLEDRNSSQGTQEAWATKANSKTLLVCSPSLRSAISWISFGRSLCLSYYTMLVLTGLQGKQKKKIKKKKEKKEKKKNRL